MADDFGKPGGPVDLSIGMMRRVARAWATGVPEARDSLASPLAQAFNKLGAGEGMLPTRLPFMGTSPVTYTTYRGMDGQIHQDGKRGIEYQVQGTEMRLLAGSYHPDRAQPDIEHWTAAVAWTPINLSGLRLGPIVGDTARSDRREGAVRPFERVGLTAGLYVTSDDKEGGLFARIENDPGKGGKPRVMLGLKMPFGGQ